MSHHSDQMPQRSPLKLHASRILIFSEPLAWLGNLQLDHQAVGRFQNYICYSDIVLLKGLQGF